MKAKLKSEFFTGNFIHAAKDETRVSPTKVRVPLGALLELRCLSSYDVMWFHDFLKSEPIHKYDLLKINAVTVTDNGYYYCYGTYSNKRHFIARITVTVVGKYITCIIISDIIFALKHYMNMTLIYIILNRVLLLLSLIISFPLVCV